MADFPTMKVHILGCYAPYPPVNGAGPGYLLEHATAKVLLDCGSGVVSNLGQVCDLQNSDLSAVILSHLHSDHFCDLLVLRYARFMGMRAGQASPLLVLSPEQPPLERSLLPFLNTLDIRPIIHENTIDIAGIRFDFTRTKHIYPAYAVRAMVEGKTLVYTGDTAWQDNLVDFCQNADLLLAEASFLEKNKGANTAEHLSAGDAGRLAQAAHVKKLVLTHFWPADDLMAIREEARTQFSGEIILAASGLTIEV